MFSTRITLFAGGAVAKTAGLCLLSALCLTQTPAAAATAIFTNGTDFLTAVGNLPIFLNEFTNFGYLGWLAHPINANDNGIGYRITSQPPVELVAFDGAVSTYSTNDNIVVTFTTGNVTGAGGYFYTADQDATAISGTVTISLSDGTVTNVTSSSGQPAPFLGFLSDGPLLSSLTITNSSGDGFPALTHFYVVDPVPSPSIALAGTGRLLLSWPAGATGLLLEASPTGQGGTWTNVTFIPQTVANQVQTFVPVSSKTAFFRLKKL